MSLFLEKPRAAITLSNKISSQHPRLRLVPKEKVLNPFFAGQPTKTSGPGTVYKTDLVACLLCLQIASQVEGIALLTYYRGDIAKVDTLAFFERAETVFSVQTMIPLTNTMCRFHYLVMRVIFNPHS